MQKIRFAIRPTLMTVASVLAIFATSHAHAAIVYSGPVNLTIPNSAVGLYLNVIDGTTFTGPDTFPTLGGPGANYDINIYSATGATYTFFSPGTAGQSSPTVPATSRGYVSASTTGGVVSLTQGTLIGGSSVFNTGSPSGSLLSGISNALVGFRFRNETGGANTVHFGWARLSITNGQPGTLVDYGYESTPNTAIGAGVSGVVTVPEAGTLPMVLGVGVSALAGIVLRRRKTVR